MVYKIEFSSKAKHFIKKLQKDISDRLILKFKTIKENPFRHIEHYSEKGLYKIRIGDFRALVDIDINKEMIFVRVIDKRSRVYKK